MTTRRPVSMCRAGEDYGNGYGNGQRTRCQTLRSMRRRFAFGRGGWRWYHLVRLGLVIAKPV